MQIIYVNKGTSPRKFAEYMKKYNNSLEQQAQKYNQLLMEGLTENGASVFSISSRPINRRMTRQKFFKGEKDFENGIDYYYVPFFNVKLLRELSVFTNFFFKILFRKGKRKETVVICDALNVMATAGALAASALRGFETVGIVTDVPGCSYSQKKLSFNGKINIFLMNRFQKYLLLTEQMNDLINKNKRPYLVLEGHTDGAMAEVSNELSKKYEKKVCLYAGSLRAVYGIGNLVEGFLKANVDGTELHVYGNGDYRETLEKYAEANDSVKYFGVVPNTEIVEAELKATLLVNPRPTAPDYTKYSFPSKNMEYMASGTPILTTNLPGMPAEYKPYVFLLEEETVDGMAKKLTEIMSLSSEELHRKGAEAKEWVLREKGAKKQAERLIDFLNAQVNRFELYR